MNDTTKQERQRFEVQHGLRDLHFIQDWKTDNVYDVLMEHGANRIVDLLNALDAEITRLTAMETRLKAQIATLEEKNRAQRLRIQHLESD